MDKTKMKWPWKFIDLNTNDNVPCTDFRFAVTIFYRFNELHNCKISTSVERKSKGPNFDFSKC